MNDDRPFKNINHLALFAIIFQIIFIIFCVITIKTMLDEKASIPKINISNYSDIPEISSLGQDEVVNNMNATIDNEKKSNIEGALYDVVSLNNIGKDILKNGAVIRKDSAHYVYISDLDIYLINFIVDLEDLGQSYRIVYRWTNHYPNKNAPPNKPVVAFCLREEELVYGNFDCKDDYGGYGADLIVYDLLRYHMFNDFYINFPDDYENGGLSITIVVKSEGESVQNRAVQNVSDYLFSLGFNLDDFKHEVVYRRPFFIYQTS